MGITVAFIVPRTRADVGKFRGPEVYQGEIKTDTKVATVAFAVDHLDQISSRLSTLHWTVQTGPTTVIRIRTEVKNRSMQPWSMEPWLY